MVEFKKVIKNVMALSKSDMDVVIDVYGVPSTNSDQHMMNMMLIPMNTFSG